MSVHAISWVLRHSESRLGARLVMIVIADHADATGGTSYPSVATIATESRISERAVQYALRQLERSGELTLVGTSRYGTQVWQITGMATPDREGADSAGVQSTTDFVPDSAPEPSLEPTTTTSGGADGGLGTPPSHPQQIGQYVGSILEDLKRGAA